MIYGKIKIRVSQIAFLTSNIKINRILTNFYCQSLFYTKWSLHVVPLCCKLHAPIWVEARGLAGLTVVTSSLWAWTTCVSRARHTCITLSCVSTSRRIRFVGLLASCCSRGTQDGQEKEMDKDQGQTQFQDQELITQPQ